MNPIYGPLLDAEVEYRRARITSDFAASARWAERVHRTTRLLLHRGPSAPTTEATSSSEAAVRRQVRRAAAH